ncbi:universal stress protein [Alkalinema pantanalense CENA528]|uniref:universal stress protein n=1 Tax=Alkalinema pantanalense TaxID=1620705 RepID=UPI003D6EBC67
MIERILLADSGTGHSEEMLKALLAIPSVQRAFVTILHVVPQERSAESMETKRQEGEALMANVVERLKLDPAKVTTMLRMGDPKGIVCEVAEEVNTDLIIMGSRGLKRLTSILSNSVSQYVFQLSSRPMLLVRDDLYVRPIQRIMVAIDKSDTAKRCLDLAIFLLRDIPGGRLHLVHADANAKEDLSGAAAEKDAILAAALAQAKRYDIDTRCWVAAGSAGQAICRTVEDVRADLLLLGSPDRRPSIAKSLPDLDRLLGSSLSDYVRVHANCPVLMARTAG